MSLVVLRSPYLACRGWGSYPVLQMPTVWRRVLPNINVIALVKLFLFFPVLFF